MTWSRVRRRALSVASLLAFASSCHRTAPRGFDLVAAVPASGWNAGSSAAAGLDFAGDTPTAARVEIDHERRDVVLTGTQAWHWSGRVPAAGAHLHAGVQALPAFWSGSGGLDVRIEAQDGDVREVLEVARARPEQPQRWLDLDVDLSPYAGREITLAFIPQFNTPAAPAGAPAPRIAWGPVRLAAGRQPAQRRPNVLFVLVDTLRADHLPAYGYGRDTAPRVQEFLAKQGTVVEEAYSQAPWTLPSVTSFLTGRLPGELLRGAMGSFGLPAGVETMAEHFARLGYRTGGFYANPTLYSGIGFERGFGTYYCPPPDLNYSMNLHAESVTDRAGAWLRAHQDEPFFLYVHLIDPHDPYDNPDIVANRSPFEDQPYTGNIAGSWIHGIWLGKISLANPVADRAHITALYDAEIHYADRRLGELFAQLRPEVLRDTLIVLTADHGEELYDHGGWKHGQTLYQEQIHVPLLLRWDGHIPSGRRLPGTVRLLDLLPTLNAAVGGAVDPAWQGTNLLPALLGEAAVPRQSAVAENFNAGPLRAAAILDGRKLMLFNRRSPFVPADEQQERLWRIDVARMQRSELYDLANDPHELANRAEQEPRAVAERERLILHQLDRELPGVRVLFSSLPKGQRVSGSIEFDKPPVRWSSYFLGDADRVQLHGQRLEFDLQGDGLDKGVIVEGEFAELRRLEFGAGAGVAATIGNGLRYLGGTVPLAQLGVPDVPTASGDPALRIWVAAARGTRGTHPEENPETLQRLRALGYIQ